MKPRAYQTEAVASILKEFETVQRTLCVMATGAGKTQVAGYVADHFLKNNLGRIMIVCHREELIRQAAHRFEQITGIKPEIEKAEEWASEITVYGKCPIIVASVQTLISGKKTKRYTRFDPKEFGLLWVDESHHATARSFEEVIVYFCQNPQLKCLGVTATPDRADKTALGKIFQSTAFEYELPDIIADGYLVPIRQRSVEIAGLDFSRVRTVAGDLNAADLEAAMLYERPMQGTAFATIELACGLEPGTLGNIGENDLLASKVAELIGTNRRRKTLIFTVTVAHAQRMAQILNRWIDKSAVDVNGEMSRDLRRENIKRFADGDAQFLVNCMVLTEGADLPMTECVVMARPTKSRALFTQMLGRGTRPAADIAHNLGELETPDERRTLIAGSSKPNMLCLDFVGNSGKHKLISAVDVLGGEVAPEILELAKEYTRGEEMEVGKAIDLAREELERRQRESEARKKKLEEERVRAEEAEVARRAGLVARADYSVTDYDPYKPVFNLENGEPQQEDALSFCQKNLHKSQFKKVTWQNADKIRADILRRKAGKLASWKQIRILESNGWKRADTLNMPMKKAGAIMDGLFKQWNKSGGAV